MLCGEVHDENCRSMGGVAGHAGLFGTVEGVLSICSHLLRQWRGDEEHPNYSSNLLRDIFAYRSDSAWRYGFDTPSKINSSSGQLFSSLSVGHLGFTGTSFWIDLERGVAVVLLTNRVHPSRANEKYAGSGQYSTMLSCSQSSNLSLKRSRHDVSFLHRALILLFHAIPFSYHQLMV